MLAQETRDAWKKFLLFAKSRCSATAFGNWLAPVDLVAASDDEITLQVPNIFVKEYLLSNYKQDLCSFLPVRSPGEPAIRFVITPPKPKMSAAAESELGEKVTPVSQGCSEVHLNPRYRFDRFVVGACNQFPLSAARSVAESPMRSYNPLFVYGSVGLGKTHILHAIGHEIKARHPRLRVQVITTEQFINDLVDALRKKTIDRLKKFYRHDVDVLLVDDIQFLQNRLNFEEEFCNMFESLINQNKQIVIASDKAPAKLKLSERMTARMEWGLVAHIGAPDLETRVAILHHKAEQKGLSLANEVAFFIAENVCGNVRQLEGAINRLSAQCRLLNMDITEELVERTLGEMFHHTPQRRVSVEEILKASAAIFQVKLADLKGKGRTKEVALARQVAMYLAKSMVQDSLSMIGSAFGKTHSTILHACKTIEKKMAEDETLRRQVQMVRRNIEAD